MQLAIGDGVDVELHDEGGEASRTCNEIERVVCKIVYRDVSIVESLVGHAVDDQLTSLREKRVYQEQLESCIDWDESI